ncbi:MAG TPA: hypothetical protein VFM93_10700 [Candidatus Limnocylindria bacterium]|nr:hypothetical protein [Candidatus Limnocylindria bacterium]
MSRTERDIEELLAADARSREVRSVRVRGGDGTGSVLATAGSLAVLALAVALAAFLVRGDAPGPTVATSPSPVPASASPPSASCADPRLPGETPLGPSVEAGDVTITLDRVTNDPSGRAVWAIRYFVKGDAPRPVTLASKLGISRLSVQGQTSIGPPNAGGVPFLAPVEIAPCRAMVEIVPTSFVPSGRYTIQLLGLTADPAGRAATIEVDVECPSRGDCARAGQARPSPSPTPDRRVLRDSWLVVFDGALTGWEKGAAPLLKRETQATAVGELAPSFFNQFHGAVSPDGRRAVYAAWALSSPRELYLLEGARPNVRTKLLTLTGELGGADVWSTDGEGVLIWVTDGGADQGVRPKYSAVRSYVIGGDAPRELLRVGGGAYLRGLLWDRRADRIVLGEIPYGGAGPTRLHIIDRGRGRAIELEKGTQYVPSPDGRDAVVVSLRVVSIVPIDEPSRRREIARLPDAAGVIGWRPATREVVILRNEGGRTIFSAVNADSGASRDIGSIAGSPGRAPIFRADGSGFILDMGLSPALLMDATTGAVAALPADPEGRRPSGSLRAD